MTARISLALVIHNHQPVGNFGWVIDEVYRQAYEPMIDALERHPPIRLGLHYTGPLLEWMDANQPQAIERLQALVNRGQVEILGGAQFEPILAALPDRDRHAQLVRMREDLARRFGTAPAGAWLAERVWEPSLPFDLAAAGYAYTVLDDNHLRSASVGEDAMWATYTTDDRGRRLTIFGTEKGLRYRIPFRPVKELIDYLRAAATESGDRLGTMGDDGEKFGAWPGTFEHCWGKNGWVEECFTALADNADWLSMVTPSEWMATHPPAGRIYVPTSSYVEMTQWALPAHEANEFHLLLEQAAARSSVAQRFLRGGFWRNFQARYREINDLHKQMLRVSAAVERMSEGREREAALDHLYRGQSNDSYWHGLFGGIYIVHMRLATLAELIAAEDVAAGDAATSGVADHDLDGIDEVLLGTRGQTVLIEVAEGAGIGAWDLRATRIALASVMRRRPEAYHETLRAAEAAQARGEKATGKTATSIHDQLLTKEKGLSSFLVYDDYERRSGLVRLVSSTGHEIGEFVSGPWLLESAVDRQAVVSRAVAGLELRKTVDLAGGRADPSLQVLVQVHNKGLDAIGGHLELEWNLNLAGGGGNPAAYYRWNGSEARHDGRGIVSPGTVLSFGNEYEGVDIVASAEPAAEAAWYPVETISNSEAGFERIYQGSCLVYRWPLALPAGGEASFSIRFEVAQTRDRLTEEGAS